MTYAVTLEPDDNGTLLVSFPDFPEAHTFGNDEADALAHARDALATVVEAYMRDGQALPPPSTGRWTVDLDARWLAHGYFERSAKETSDAD